jgi:hypothetical protein
LGVVCLPAAGQTKPAAEQPKAQPSPSAPAQPQPPSDEEIMSKISQATIEWDSKTIPGAKAEVRLVKKDQVDGKPVVQYRLKVSGMPNNKFYTLMAWPITIGLPVTMMDGLVIATDGTVGCPPDSTKTCGQRMKGAELTLSYTPGIGEIFRHALVSEDHKSSVFFSIVPAPMIEHDKACSLEIVRLMPRFELALVRGKGFAPGDQVSFHTESYQEVHDMQAKVNPEGEFWATLTPFVKSRTMGTTKVTVKSKTCSPALAFEWGSE